MKRLFLSVRNFFKPSNSEQKPEADVTNVSSVYENKLTGDNPKVVLTSKEDEDMKSVTSRKLKIKADSYVGVLLDFLNNEPRAKSGFTAIELHGWMGGSLGMSAISKTLYRMKVCGFLSSVVKEDDGRIRVWTLISKK